MEPDRAAAPTGNDGAGSECACFECDAPADTRWREHSFPYGAGTSAVELNVALPVRVCRSCGFEFLDHEGETLQHEAVCAHLGVLTPKEIRGIRRMHGMSRAEFSRVTGLGEATLNRWENAILIQNAANDRYLRLLARHENVRRLERLDAAGARRSSTPEAGQRRGRTREARSPRLSGSDSGGRRSP